MCLFILFLYLGEENIQKGTEIILKWSRETKKSKIDNH